MSDERHRHGPRGEDQEEAPEQKLDTEGGGAHLVHVIAHNALKEIIIQAKEKVSVEEGTFKIPSYVMDELLIKCEKALLNYGEEEALKCMVDEIMAYLKRIREFKARDNERKVRERLPSKGKEHGDQHRRV